MLHLLFAMFLIIFFFFCQSLLFSKTENNMSTSYLICLMFYIIYDLLYNITFISYNSNSNVHYLISQYFIT